MPAPNGDWGASLMAVVAVSGREAGDGAGGAPGSGRPTSGCGRAIKHRRRDGGARASVVYLPDVTFAGLRRRRTIWRWRRRAGDLRRPSHGCRVILRQTAHHLGRHATIVSATKGLEADSHCACPGDRRRNGPRSSVGRAVGPSFMMGGPAAPTAATRHRSSAGDRTQNEFRGPFAAYGGDDVVGGRSAVR